MLNNRVCIRTISCSGLKKSAKVTAFCYFPCRKYMSQLVTGYLPSVILMLFLYIAPPFMILLSTLEGAISRSGRKKSTCLKLLYFMIWNVFFANILTGTLIKNILGEVARRISEPKMIPNALATAIPKTVIYLCLLFSFMLVPFPIFPASSKLVSVCAFDHIN